MLLKGRFIKANGVLVPVEEKEEVVAKKATRKARRAPEPEQAAPAPTPEVKSDGKSAD